MSTIKPEDAILELSAEILALPRYDAGVFVKVQDVQALVIRALARVVGRTADQPAQEVK